MTTIRPADPLPAYLLVGLAVLAVAGCAARHDGPAPQPPVKAISTMSSNTTVGLPEAVPNLQVLAQRPATPGSAAAGSFFAHRGDVWVGFRCLGDGTATVSYAPVGRVAIPCTGGAVNATQNKIFFPDDRHVDLRVEAPGSVQWSVLVQQ